MSIATTAMAEALGRMGPGGAAADQGIIGAVYAIVRGSNSATAATGNKAISPSSVAMTTDSIFRLTELTELMTGAACCELAAVGRLGLREPVSRYIPAFADVKVLKPVAEVPPGTAASLPSSTAGYTLPAGYVLVDPKRPVLMIDLLQHRSGIGRNFYRDEEHLTPTQRVLRDLLWAGSISTYPCAADRGTTLATHVANLAKFPLAFHPGEGYLASDGFDVAAAVMDCVLATYGTSFSAYITNTFITPLSMVDTYWQSSLPTTKAARLVQLARRNDTGTGLTVPADSDYVISTAAGNVSLPTKDSYIEDTSSSPVYVSGGTGLVSTAGDFIKFLQMLRDNGMYNNTQIMDKSAVDLLLSASSATTDWDGITSLSDLFICNGGAVLKAPGDTGVCAPAGVYTWGGMYSTVAIIDRTNTVAGLVFAQGLQDADYYDKLVNLLQQALAASYV